VIHLGSHLNLHRIVVFFSFRPLLVVGQGVLRSALIPRNFFRALKTELEVRAQIFRCASGGAAGRDRAKAARRAGAACERSERHHLERREAEPHGQTGKGAGRDAEFTERSWGGSQRSAAACCWQRGGMITVNGRISW
jgi:hypothetical protein